jgi:hypothetical protein
MLQAAPSGRPPASCKHIRQAASQQSKRLDIRRVEQQSRFCSGEEHCLVLVLPCTIRCLLDACAAAAAAAAAAVHNSSHNHQAH